MASKLTQNAVRIGAAIALVVGVALASSWLHASFERRAFDRVLGWFGLRAPTAVDDAAGAAAGSFAAVEAAGRAALREPALLPGPRELLPPATAGRAATADAAESGRLDAAVVVGGIEQTRGDGRIALPSGSRFQLRLRSDRNGFAEVFGTTPDGRSPAEPLWSGPLRAGTDTLTPAMRLEGTRGVETLRVLMRGDGGGARQSSAVIAERRLQLWHL